MAAVRPSPSSNLNRCRHLHRRPVHVPPCAQAPRAAAPAPTPALPPFQLDDEMYLAPVPEESGFLSKLWGKCKREPFIPIGRLRQHIDARGASRGAIDLQAAGECAAASEHRRTAATCESAAVTAPRRELIRSLATSTQLLIHCNAHCLLFATALPLHLFSPSPLLLRSALLLVVKASSRRPVF